MYVNRAIINPANRSNNSHVTYIGHHLPLIFSKGEKRNLLPLVKKGSNRHHTMMLSGCFHTAIIISPRFSFVKREVKMKKRSVIIAAAFAVIMVFFAVYTCYFA